MKSSLWAFGLGLLFAVALGLGGMTQPERIIGFLDFGGSWDPTLLGFMGTAVVTFFVLHRLSLHRVRPVAGGSWPRLAEPRIDARLLGGAAIFGMGWGLAGYCPGPAVVSLTTGSLSVLVFVVAMGGGMGLHALLQRRPEAPEQHPELSAPSCG